MIGSGSCVSTSSAATAGWRPTLTSAPSTGRWCGLWPGNAAPPAWPSKPTGRLMSWRPSARYLRRPRAGGPGGTPPPRSSTTGAATRSLIPTGPLALSPTTRPSGPTDNTPAPSSSGFTPSSAPPTAPVTPSRPASPPPSRDLTSSVAGQAPSGPPASTTRKEHPMANPRPWPFDDDRPSGSVRPLSQADLQAILGHLGDDPDQLL